MGSMPACIRADARRRKSEPRSTLTRGSSWNRSDVRGSTLDSVPTPTRAMKIGEVAQRTDLSLWTQRHDDEVGLRPVVVLRPSTGSQ